MQNEKKYIRYKGITRLPSDHDSFDGELEDSVNLSITEGELRPVLPPALIGIIPGQFLFVHKNQRYEHFIALDGTDIKAYNYNGTTITLIGTITNIYGDTLKKVESVGGTLIILTDKEIKYALWKNTSYIYLGNKLPFPVISFALATAMNTRFWVIYDSYSSDIGKLNRREGYNPRRSSDRKSSVSSDFENDIMGKINSKLQQIQENSAFIFPFFVRYALRMYDGSLVMHSQPFLMLPSKFIPFHVSIDDASLNKIEFDFPFASKLTYSFPAISGISNYSDIIQSVDVFISSPIYSYLYDGHITGMIDNPDYDPGKYYPEKIIGGFFKNREDLMNEITSVGNFYKVLSIKIGDFETAQSTKDLIVKNLDALVNQEPMKDDYRTHDIITAENSFTYNHKLHLSGVAVTRFPGFKLGTKTCYYDGAKSQAVINIGDQPFVFYPNADCKRLHMKSTVNVQGVTNYKDYFITLSEHKLLNGSFYVDPDLKNIENVATPSPIEVIPIIYGLSQPLKDLEYNKLYVSAFQNPFYFPVESRVTLPVGKILAISSNTQGISQGQFGQFPLYAFTDDGIWALEVNNEGKYMARQPVSRDVVINPNIMQMDKALAFVTGKGLTLLSGVNTETISEIIRENNIRSSKISIAGVISALETAEMLSVDIGDDLMRAYESVPFETFSAGADLAYDYITGGGRILVINPLYDYMYVFDLATSTWSKVLGSYKRVVNNYPDSYVQDGDGKVYNLAHIPYATSTKTTCMIITRPISYEDYNFVIRSMAHRGIFKSALNVVIYASRNGVDYAPIMHRREKLIRMNGSGFRYYKLLVIADLDPNEALSGIEIDFMLKYPNRMR